MSSHWNQILLIRFVIIRSVITFKRLSWYSLCGSWFFVIVSSLLGKKMFSGSQCKWCQWCKRTPPFTLLWLPFGNFCVIDFKKKDFGCQMNQNDWTFVMLSNNLFGDHPSIPSVPTNRCIDKSENKMFFDISKNNAFFDISVNPGRSWVFQFRSKLNNNS